MVSGDQVGGTVVESDGRPVRSLLARLGVCQTREFSDVEAVTGESGHILNVQSIDFADGLGVRCERKWV